MGKQFHIGDVLSITTDRLVSTRGMEGVYEILDYMTKDGLFTHQLPRALQECKPWLFRQYPELANVDISGLDKLDEDPDVIVARKAYEDAEKEWDRCATMYHATGRMRDSEVHEALKAATRAQSAARDHRNAVAREWIGNWLKTLNLPEWYEIEPIPADDHARRDPVEELEQMAPGKVIVVEREDI